MSGSLRLVYAGTPDFAVPALRALAGAGHTIRGVFTRPDRPAGRGRRLTPPPVKRAAQTLELPVHQPERLDADVLAQAVGDAGLDALVVVAFGQILPRTVLASPRWGALNVHASLLPRWRGSAPIARALLAGDSVTGVTIMRMEPGLDSGPILLQRACAIEGSDTAPVLHDRLAELGAEAIATVCDDLPAYIEAAEPQDEAAATYAAKLSREEGRIDWREPAAELERRVRALQPWPAAWTTLDGEIWRIWAAQVPGETYGAEPGVVVTCTRHGIDVATASGVLRLLRVQPAGRRAMSAADLANARDLTGCRFGN